MKKTTNIKEKVTYSCFFGYLFFTILSLSEYRLILPSESVSRIFYFLLIFLAFVNIFTMKAKLKVWFSCLLIGSILMLSAYNSQNTSLFNVFILIMVFKNYDFDKTIKVLLISTLVPTFTVLLSFYMGILPDVIRYRQSGLPRQSLGFSHNLYLGNFFFAMSMQIIYLYKDKIKTVHTIILIIIELPIFLLTDGRTVFNLMIVQAILIFIYQHVSRDKKNFNRLFSWMYGILAFFSIIFTSILSIWFASNYNGNGVLYRLNGLLSGRPELWNHGWRNYNPQLMGQAVNEVSSIDILTSSRQLNYFVIDNAYLQLILRFGIITFIMYVLFFVVLIIFLVKHENVIVLSQVIVFGIYGFISNGPLYFYRNYFLLFGILLFNSRNEIILSSLKYKSQQDQ